MSTANHGRRGRVWRRLRAQVLRQEPTCYWCGRRPSTCVDHLLPLSQRPDLAHVRSNLVGACMPCNASKGDRARPGKAAPKPPPRQPLHSRPWW